MHGPEKSLLARSVVSFGIAPSATSAAAAARLEAEGFAFLPLAAYAPVAQQLLDLRPLLGLRSPANSLARLLNPLAAPNIIQGVFHPAYRELQRGAAALLGQKRLAVFKGGGGEAERNPDKACRVFVHDDARNIDEDWPALDGDPVAVSRARAIVDGSLARRRGRRCARAHCRRDGSFGPAPRRSRAGPRRGGRARAHAVGASRQGALPRERAGPRSSKIGADTDGLTWRAGWGQCTPSSPSVDVCSQR